MQAVLRPIEEKDNMELGRLIRSVLKEFGANKPGTVYFDASTDRLTTLFDLPKSAYWVLEADGKVIGGGGIFPTANLPHATCELVKLYLLPIARGKGLGKALIEQCFASAKALGYENIYLESMPELNQAVNLYKHLGFEQLDGALGNSGHFGCDIWMLKKLA